MKQFGLSSDGDWKIRLEAEVQEEILGERRLSQIDVVAQNEQHLVFIECKFTEQGGGPCSQTRVRAKGRPRQCNGDYVTQRHPAVGS